MRSPTSPFVSSSRSRSRAHPTRSGTRSPPPSASSAWFLPTDCEERLGGRLVTHMGPEDAPADIVGWDPPRRFVYTEDISGVPGAEAGAVTPLVSEFLVEARSGGTCLVRVVSSAFGVGADWEQEFIADMKDGWVPYFEQLRLYLRHFPGQRATTFTIAHGVPGDATAVRAAVHAALGGDHPGDRIELAGTVGTIDRTEPVLLIRLDAPVRGMLRIATGGPFGKESTEIGGYLFPPAGIDADAIVEEQQDLWMTFLQELTAEVQR